MNLNIQTGNNNILTIYQKNIIECSNVINLDFL